MRANGVEPDEEAATEQLAALLTRIVSAGVDLAMASASTVDLSLTQFRTLAIVDRHGPLRLTALAEMLGVAPSSATQICDRLASAGLIRRSRNSDDQRVVHLELSDAGHALVESVRASRARQVREILDRLPDGRRPEVLAALAALAEALGPPAGEHTMFGWT